jgi:uncharacterized protein YbcI
MQKRRGEIESKLTEAMVKFEREFMGRGPTEARTHIIEDMVLVRLKGVLSRAEHNLIREDPTGRGRDLIKQSRTEMLERAKPMLRELVEEAIGLKVVSMHTDLSVHTGERIILFTLHQRWAG